MPLVLIEFAIRALLIAAGTAGVLRILRIRTAAARHAAWTGVIAVMLLLPLWSTWGPKVRVRLLAPLPELTTSRTIVAPGALERPGLPAEISGTRPVPRLSWTAWLLGIYLAGLGVLLARLILGTAQAHWLVRGAGRRDGKLFSGSCTAPVTVGWLRPVMVLPESWSDWPGAQLDAVLIHEQEHARRRDYSNYLIDIARSVASTGVRMRVWA